MNVRTGWLAIVVAMALAGCNQTSSTPRATPATDQTTGANVTPKSEGAATPAPTGGSMSTAANEVTLPSGLKIQDVKVGDGAEAEDGMTAHVHYTGWLTDGTKFDSSRDRGQPFDFKIGGGQVIRGWDEGVKGMKVHGVRRLTVPPDMGYGANGYPPVIPANATLVFEVELLGLN